MAVRGDTGFSKKSSRLSLQTLQLLVDIADQGSFAEAAVRANLVPSAVTRRIQQLERSLGLGLIHRNSGKIQFTPQGLILLDRARRLLREAESIWSELAEFDEGSRGRVRIAASLSAAVNRLPDDMAEFSRLHPNVSIDYLGMSTPQVINALLKDRADIGLFVATDVPPEIVLHPYASDRLCVIMPTGSMLARRRAIRLADLDGHPLVGAPQDTVLTRVIAEQAARLRIRLSERVRGNGLEERLRMVQAGLGVAVASRDVWERLGPFRGLSAVPLRESWGVRPICLALVRDRPLSGPAAALVRQMIPSDTIARK